MFVAGLHGDAHWAFGLSELLAFLLGLPAGGVLMAVIGASQTYSVVNNALRVPRPSRGLVRILEHPRGYHWPSGHSSFALVQATLLVVAVAATRWVARPAPSWRRWACSSS